MTLVYYVFGSTVFTALLTTLITLLIIGGIGVIIIFKKIIKPMNDSGISKVMSKFKKNR
jgi:hypothetical protein